MYCGITDPEKNRGNLFHLPLARCDLADSVVQLEAARFEDAIISTSKEKGRTGIVLLPNVRALIDGVSTYCWSLAS